MSDLHLLISCPAVDSTVFSRQACLSHHQIIIWMNNDFTISETAMLSIVLTPYDQLSIREAPPHQNGWIFRKKIKWPPQNVANFWGHVDVCTFWHRFTVKYILNINENLQFRFLLSDYPSPPWKKIRKFICFGGVGLPLMYMGVQEASPLFRGCSYIT